MKSSLWCFNFIIVRVSWIGLESDDLNGALSLSLVHLS